MMKKNNLKKIVSVFIAAMLLLSCSACLFITNAGAVIIHRIIISPGIE